MSGSILFTALFALTGGIPLSTLAWMGNRCTQSLGWAGMVKITSHWFSYSACLSFLFGDAASREAALRILALVDFGGSRLAPVVLVTLIGFVMTGRYSYLAGATSLDFGGKQGSGTASGLIDGAGYLGGVLSGNSVAGISVSWGWNGAFLALASVALLSSVAAGAYLTERRRQSGGRQ